MQAKGTTIIFFPEFIKTKFGEEAFSKWMDALSPEARNVFSGVILPSSWYSLKEIFIEPTKLICDMFYGGSIKGAYELGGFSADYALHGIYKFFLKLGSPEYMIKKAGTILPTYYDPCKMEVAEMTSGHAVLRITEFTEIDNKVEERIRGWCERALAIAGGKELSVKITKSLANGGEFTEFDINWKL